MVADRDIDPVPGVTSRPPPTSSPRFACTQLLLVSALFGATLPIIQFGLRFFGPFTFMAIRFVVGSVILAAVFAHRIARMSRRQLAAGALTGVLAFAAWSLQTAALQYSTVSMVGFITAMYVPLVAILSAAIFRQMMSRLSLAGVAFSTAGMLLLSLGPGLAPQIGRGELLTLGCALATACHILAIDRFVTAADAAALATVQVATVAVLSTALAILMREPLLAEPLTAWASPTFMGIFATALGFVLMNRAQQHITAMAATLIYALEPAWSGLTGFLVGNHLSLPNWFGCISILLGTFVSQLGPRSARPGVRQSRLTSPNTPN